MSLSRTRRFVECWWLVFVLPMGLLNWAAFFYIGLRAGRRRWLAYAVLYFAALWPIVALSEAFDPADLDDKRADLATALVLVLWGVSSLHALYVRPRFLELLQERRAAPPDLEFERRVAAEVAHERPQLARTVGIGRPDRPGAEHADLVDVNGAPVAVLARLPGIDDTIARQIAETRPYASVEELGSTLDLPALVVEELRERTVFIPR